MEREPLRRDPGAVLRVYHPVDHALDDHGGRQRRHPVGGPRRCDARHHRRERSGRPGGRPVRRRRMHADARDQVGVGGREDERHRAACGQARHVDPPRVDPPTGALVDHGARHARELRGLAAAALLVARLVPAPAAVGMVTGRLFGRDEHDAVPVGDRGEPGGVDELLGLLVAAVQQHQQRRATASAVPGREVHRAQPTAQHRACHPSPRRRAPDQGGHPRRPSFGRHNTRS